MCWIKQNKALVLCNEEEKRELRKRQTGCFQPFPLTFFGFSLTFLFPFFTIKCIDAIGAGDISVSADNMESCPSGRRCSTRNAVSRKGPRVRIPNSPPVESLDTQFAFGAFLFIQLSARADSRYLFYQRFPKALENNTVFKSFFGISR